MADESEDIRVCTIRSLGEVGDPRAVTVLGEALKEKNVEVVQHAVQALGRIGGEGVLPLLGSDEVVHGAAWVAYDGVKAVIRIGGPKAVRVLEKYAVARRSRDARGQAIKVLGEAGGDHIQDVLIKAVDVPGAPLHTLAEAIGKIGGPKAWPVMEKLCQHRYGSIRRSAARAVVGPKMDPAKAEALLIRLVPDPDKYTRAVAAQNLIGFKSPKVREAMLKQLPKEDDRAAKEAIIKYLRTHYRDDDKVNDAIRLAT